MLVCVAPQIILAIFAIMFVLFVENMVFLFHRFRGIEEFFFSFRDFIFLFLDHDHDCNIKCFCIEVSIWN